MKKIGLLLFLAISILACRKDEDVKEEIVVDSQIDVTVNMKATYNGDLIDASTVYYDHMGHRIRIDYLLTYLSNIQLIDSEGTSLEIKDIFLANMIDGMDSFTVKLDPKAYDEIKFGVGVPEEINEGFDPSVYPSSSPLSPISNQGMFWTWNSGYIFVKYEGKIDLSGTEGAALEAPFAFHCGEDELFRDHQYSLNNFEIKEGNSNTINIVFEVDKFLSSAEDSINLEENYLTHTSGNFELAERFINIFKEAVHVEN